MTQFLIDAEVAHKKRRKLSAYEKIIISEEWS